jgi:outer membrane lipoprotein-sorting protein
MHSAHDTIDLAGDNLTQREKQGARVMKRVMGMFLILIAFSGAIAAAAGDEVLSPARIIAQADRARGNLDGIVWTADITSVEQGDTQQRSLLIKNRGVNTVAEFTAPAKVKGNKIVMLDRNMWFVKPGLRKPVPISPRQKLMGGAANGDIASTNYAADYDAVPAGEEPVNEEACYVFDLTANNKKTTYDRIRYWISKKRLLGIKAEFYTVAGKRFKTAAFRYDNTIRTDTGDQPFVSRMTIFDEIIKDNVTTMDYRDARPETLPEAVFNLNLMIR